MMGSLTYISANKEPNIGGCLSRCYVFQNQPSTYQQDSALAYKVKTANFPIEDVRAAIDDLSVGTIKHLCVL